MLGIQKRNNSITRTELIKAIKGIENLNWYLYKRQFGHHTNHVAIQKLYNYKSQMAILHDVLKDCLHTILLFNIALDKLT